MVGTGDRAVRGGSGERQGPQETGLNGSGRVGRARFSLCMAMHCFQLPTIISSPYDLSDY